VAGTDPMRVGSAAILAADVLACPFAFQGKQETGATSCLSSPS